VLLPSDTHREPITSITPVLPPFVTYLLALPRNILVFQVYSPSPRYGFYNFEILCSFLSFCGRVTKLGKIVKSN
jgi:hypothetical protein